MSHAKSLCPIARPEYGISGSPIILRANHFEVHLPHDLHLFRYTKNARRATPQVILLLLRDHFSDYFQGIATDGYQTLISKHRLMLQDVPYPVLYQGTAYHVTLTLNGSLNFARLHRLPGLPVGLQSAAPSRAEYLQALNIILGHHPKFTSPALVSTSNAYFDRRAARIDLGSGLHTLRGLHAVIREAQTRLCLNVAPKFSICYNDGPLDHVLIDYMRENGSDMRKLAAFVGNLRVELIHLNGRRSSGKRSPRIKTIVGLASPEDGRDMFQPPLVRHFGAGARAVEFYRDTSCEKPGLSSVTEPGSKKRKAPMDNGYVSVYDHFRTTYNIVIRDPWLPVVKVGSISNPSYLPAEVCRVLPGQGLRRRPTTAQSQEVSRLAVSHARSRHGLGSSPAEMRAILGLHGSHGPSLSSFGLKISSEMMTVPGRVLPGPSIVYRHGKEAGVRSGAWNLLGLRFQESTKLAGWTYLYFPGTSDPGWYRQDQQSMEGALSNLYARMKNAGMNIPPPRLPGIRVSPSRDDDGLDHAMDTFLGLSLTFLVIILPRQDERLYNRVKYLCDVRKGIPNICVVSPRFLRAKDEYLSNVVFKMNLKFGGLNHTLPALSLSIIHEGKSMVVGVDVTHPTSSTSSPDTPSVAAMVASTDPFLGQWPGAVRVQPARQEIVCEIDKLLLSRLHLWQKRNHGALPENILVYRDGVSVTQYGSVLNTELPLLQKACAGLYENHHRPPPRFTIVLVEKRHQIRFQTADGRPSGSRPPLHRSSNPPNGTVVDRRITDSQTWDFYIQSHAAPRGTARPGHYVVLFDQIFQGALQRQNRRGGDSNVADALQALTYHLCYLYARATRVASICPPVFYADLACSRARCYLQEVMKPFSGKVPSSSSSSSSSRPRLLDIGPHEKIKDTMFYI
ncbi:Piwi-domain-containing protein [Aspergillus pseudocaelatus]|uniref:Piwi-domain-containing protein n=1 Tax=Aspergillus pseudocaelatus TaxID=1825620 RepID=A0ABQ6X4L0_9EURO|nr:Piwi-domain-containing protein [Aspergillus pseudocaelatus]